MRLMERLMKGLIHLLKMALPLSSHKREQLTYLSRYLSQEKVKEVRKLIKKDVVSVSTKNLGISPVLKTKITIPEISIKTTPSSRLEERIKVFNNIIEKNVKKHAFENFSRLAYEIFPSIIAPHIIGMDTIKRIIAAQLFSTERLHLLIIGDPGTGKTELLRCAAELSPIAAFGLGSGVSKAGLSMSFAGKKLIKGLLPQANGGICAIDELNLIRKEDLGALYNAMEKGFVAYDKGDFHKTLSADVRIIATANPSSKRFVSKSVKLVRSQLPFDPALLSRFHIIAVVFKPDSRKFEEIASNLIREPKNMLNEADKKFIKEYIEYSKQLSVDFPPSLDVYIKEFARELKENEDRMIVEASPRHIQGVIRIAKAFARMRLVKETSAEDIKKAISLFKELMFFS